MRGVVTVTFDSSQFPRNVRRELREALRARRVPPKFLYESAAQARKWLALHEAHSPARTDVGTQDAYERAFAAVAKDEKDGVVVVGLGSGGGQKEAALLRLLAARARAAGCVVCDVSAPLALTAMTACEEAGVACRPVVCDLTTVADLAGIIDGLASKGARRIFTFLG